jgi:hypothetical protein
VGQSPAYYSKGGSRFNARRTTEPAAESSGLVNVARYEEVSDGSDLLGVGGVDYLLPVRPPAGLGTLDPAARDPASSRAVS